MPPESAATIQVENKTYDEQTDQVLVDLTVNDASPITNVHFTIEYDQVVAECEGFTGNIAEGYLDVRSSDGTIMFNTDAPLSTGNDDALGTLRFKPYGGTTLLRFTDNSRFNNVRLNGMFKESHLTVLSSSPTLNAHIGAANVHEDTAATPIHMENVKALTAFTANITSSLSFLDVTSDELKDFTISSRTQTAVSTATTDTVGTEPAMTRYDSDGSQLPRPNPSSTSFHSGNRRRSHSRIQ